MSPSHSEFIRTDNDIKKHIIPTLRAIQYQRELFYTGNMYDGDTTHTLESAYTCGCGHMFYTGDREDLKDPFDINESETVRDYEGLFLSHFDERVQRAVKKYVMRRHRRQIGL